MKCLEKLSLVKDECMKDLQKDIEELINSYIDIEEECVKIFKEIRDSLETWDIRRINKFLYDRDVFLEGEPVLINQSGWENNIIKFFDFRNKKEIAESLKEFMYIMEVFSRRWDNQLDIENERYWMFREGANGELLFYTEKDFLDFIENLIHWETTETQIELYKILKKIKQRRL